MFKAELKGIVDRIEGGVGGVVMGLDGISVDTYSSEGSSLDVNSVGMEFSFVLGQVKKAVESAAMGALEEITIKSSDILWVARLLTPEYFFAIAVSPQGNFGKCRFLMRTIESKLKAQL